MRILGLNILTDKQLEEYMNIAFMFGETAKCLIEDFKKDPVKKVKEYNMESEDK